MRQFSDIAYSFDMFVSHSWNLANTSIKRSFIAVSSVNKYAHIWLQHVIDTLPYNISRMYLYWKYIPSKFIRLLSPILFHHSRGVCKCIQKWATICLLVLLFFFGFFFFATDSHSKRSWLRANTIIKCMFNQKVHTVTLIVSFRTSAALPTVFL